MADPKFENLPGIAYDQPDVYETPDTAEPETSDYYEEEQENDAIERMSISTKDSFNRFRNKTLDGNVDFSDRIGRRMRRGYDASSNEYELEGVGEKETPVQKCRRLQCEMNELLDEISALQVDKKVSEEDKQSYDAVTTVISTTKKVLETLRLEEVLGKEQTPDTASKEIKALIGKVDEFKQSGVLNALPAPGADVNTSARLAKLEHRLHSIEKAVGAQPEKLSRLSAITNAANITDAVRQLSTKAALLHVDQLDSIETRLNSLSTKMDAITERTTGTGGDDKHDQKIYELYEIAKRTEPVADALPDIIERMQALESLHKYAMNFSKVVSEVEEKQAAIATGLVCNKELLHSVQEKFSTNLESMKHEISKVEERIKVLSSIK